MRMPTILCLDDFTYAFSDVVQLLTENGYRALAAADSAAALELAADTPLDAVVLNCRRATDNSGLVTALRILQPRVAVIMFASYCGVPCHQLQLADACIRRARHGQRSCLYCSRCSAKADTGFAAQWQPECGANKNPLLFPCELGGVR